VSLLRPIRDTWATSVGVARERLRVGGRRRILLDWVVQAAVLLLVGNVIPGILVSSIGAALFAAVVLGLLNALVRPVIILLTLPLNVVTVGLLSLVVNAMMLTLAAPLVPGFEVTSFAGAFAAALVITILTTLISIVISADRDDTFYAELARRLSTRETPRMTGGKGLLVVQIDGLSAPILRNAIRVGLTPRMASWVRSGRYRLVEWDCAPPSQTPSSQAGILHGSNDDIPAFRWYEKERGRLMVANRPPDAAEIERRLSNGRGLLAADGVSVGNLFSGDATRSLFTMSSIAKGRAADVDAFSLYFVDPAALIRTIVLTISEALKEVLEARRQRALDIQPRVHRGAAFAGMRAVSNVLLRDLNMTFLIHAMGRGTPILYVDFVDYDELAHHAGPERLESLRSLTGVDQALASLERAAASAPRQYSIVVLSDHGQSQGTTFRQRYGSTLDEVVRALMGGDATAVTPAAEGEGWGPVNVLLSEIRARPGITGKVASKALGGRTQDGAVEVGRHAEPTTVTKEAADVIVGPSGNLANVYFPAMPGRATLEEIDERYPGLVAGLAAHPGIGFVVVKTAAFGSVAIGRAGVHNLADDRIDGEDPLALFGPRAADHVRRIDAFAHVGDLLINSSYDPELDEVAAFEELVGSHGGFGGPQTRPFVLAPSTLPFDEELLVGSPAVHRQLVRWADGLGVGPESGATTSATVDAALPKPRGIGAVAALSAVSALIELVIGVSALGIGALALLEGVSEIAGALVIGAVLTALGVAGLAVALGLWRRRRWAWMATLALQGINVIQVILVVTSSGLQGAIGLGLFTVIVAPLVFFYLTRPHVAAAFGHRRSGGRGPTSPAG
jgi:uncharacterized membrane protein YvlD (DUF360 family)